MASYDIAGMQQIVEDFTKGQGYLEDVILVIEPEENKVDPLDLLRYYGEERTLESGVKLATAFVAGKKVGFIKKGTNEIVLEFECVVGKPIQTYFTDVPFLLEVLISAAWGILLKKLTPPLPSSETEGGSSLTTVAK